MFVFVFVFVCVCVGVFVCVSYFFLLEAEHGTLDLPPLYSSVFVLAPPPLM